MKLKANSGMTVISFWYLVLLHQQHGVWRQFSANISAENTVDITQALEKIHILGRTQASLNQDAVDFQFMHIKLFLIPQRIPQMALISTTTMKMMIHYQSAVSEKYLILCPPRYRRNNALIFSSVRLRSTRSHFIIFINYLSSQPISSIICIIFI